MCMYMSRVIVVCVIIIAIMVLHLGVETYTPPFQGFQSMLPGAQWTSQLRSNNVVSFYKDTNFRGGRRDFPVGTVQASLSKGFLLTGINKENDSYSSVLVPEGMIVQTFADDNFGGAMKTYTTGSYPKLDGFNDTISSLKVIPAASSLYPASFYSDANFQGLRLTMRVGAYPMLATAGGSRDNMITSAHIEPGYRVKVYAEPNFGGAEGIWGPGDISYVGDYWNDKISSIKVEKA